MKTEGLFPFIAKIVYVAIVVIVLLLVITIIGKRVIVAGSNFIESGLASFGWKIDIDGDGVAGGREGQEGRGDNRDIKDAGLDKFDPAGLTDQVDFTNR